jgi:hypothetical protein
MTAVDDLFDSGGLAVALAYGCEFDVSVGPEVVTVSEDALSCGECDGPIQVPTTRPAFYLAVNERVNGGLCHGCDSVDVAFDVD